jgi:peptide/nickel transport system permease protein
MLRFILRRIAESLLVLLLLSWLVFVLFKLIPGDYLTEMELNPAVAASTVEAIRESYGLRNPWYTQYFQWLVQVTKGNLGHSFVQRRPAASLIWDRLKNTLALGGPVLLLSILGAFPLGVLAALQKGRWFDRFTVVILLFGLSLPAILSSFLFLYFAFWSGWFPIGGAGGARHMVLPALSLALPTAAFFTRVLRIEMIEALGQPFVLFAQARGLKPWRVVGHAFRNALNPMISLIGIGAGRVLGGTVVVEKIFNWPGVGALTVDSILSRDLFVVIGCVLTASLLMLIANLLADLLLAWNDPRIRCA